MLVKVEGHPELRKDIESGAVLQVDTSARDEYLRKRDLINSTKRNQEEIAAIKEKLGEIDNVKSDLQDIKNLLKELVTK
jgi:hypothetical protein